MFRAGITRSFTSTLTDHYAHSGVARTDLGSFRSLTWTLIDFSMPVEGSERRGPYPDVGGLPEPGLQGGGPWRDSVLI